MIIKNGKRMDGTYDNIPVGTISAFTGTTAPVGYLLCQGQKVSKTTYKELYDICKNHFGPETGTEFTLPDLRGKTLAGCDLTDGAMNSIGKLIGTKKHSHTTGNHTLTINEMPEHNHNILWATQSQMGGQYARAISGNISDNTTQQTADTIKKEGGSQPHNHGNTGESSNFQPTVVINWIVKAYMVVPSPSVVENDPNSDSTTNPLSAHATGFLINDIKGAINTSKEKVVLWSGDIGGVGSTINLSESCENFEYILITTRNQGANTNHLVDMETTISGDVALSDMTSSNDRWQQIRFIKGVLSGNTLTISKLIGMNINMDGLTFVKFDAPMGYMRVVGISRK